jgi:hypothetical protein
MHGWLLVLVQRGQEDAAYSGTTANNRVGKRLDWLGVEENQSGQLGWKTVCNGNCCGDQTNCQYGVGWEETFLGWKKIAENNLGCCDLNKKSNFWIKIEEIRIKQNFGIFSKINTLRFGCKDSKCKGENEN